MTRKKPKHKQNDDLAVFSCVMCEQGYSLNDVKKGLYFPSTAVCRACYDKMKKQPLAVNCFGKVDEDRGYNPSAIECSKECNDRALCRLFVRKRNV